MPIIVYPNKPEVVFSLDEWEYMCRGCGKIFWCERFSMPKNCECFCRSFEARVRPRYPENTRTLEHPMSWPVFEIMNLIIEPIGENGRILEM